MIFRNLAIVSAALLLAACGGEKYPVPAAEANSVLAGLGQSPAVAPMPAALSDVTAGFEPLPAGNGVQWTFTYKGEDLGRIVATAASDGATSSRVTVEYVDAATPSSDPIVDRYRGQIESGVRQLIVEAVDSALDRRPFDLALRDQVDAGITAAMVGTMFQEASRGMDEAMARHDWSDSPSSAEPSIDAQPPDPRDATKPTTDLSKFR